MSCCSSFCRSITVSASRCRAARGSRPPVCWQVPVRAGGPGQKLACAPRGRSTPVWGAGAHLDREPCRPDRGRRPEGHRVPSPRRLATTRVWWLAPGIRCTSGPAPRGSCRPDRQKTCVRAPPRNNTTAIRHWFRTGALRPTVTAWPRGRWSTTTSPAQHSTPRFGSRTTCRPGRRVPARPPACAWTGPSLTLDVPVDHPVWCPGDHTPPLRVSGIQSGNWSGPVGSPHGQQRFREGQVVREEQERFEGWLPTGGRVAIRARMNLSPRSMAALWMSGFEDDPEQLRCGEICVFEIFGNALADDPPSAEVGVGIKAFRDPALTQDFAAPRVADRRDRLPHVRRRLGRRRGGLHRRRRGGTPLPAPADVPPAADAGRLRLPGVVGRRRRPPGAGAGGRPDPSAVERSVRSAVASSSDGCRSASRSAGRRGGRSGPPCRWRARAGSRARSTRADRASASTTSTALTWAGDRAWATISAGSSDQSTMSIFSPCSSDITLRTRWPIGPMQAPLALTPEAVDLTAILVRCPASRAIAAISTVPSAISGTSRANSFFTRLGWERDRVICGPRMPLRTETTRHLIRVPWSYFSPGHPLAERQQRLELAEVDHHVVGVATLLDHAGDDVALLAGELTEPDVVLGVAQPLQHDLLRGGRGDPAEAVGRVVVLADLVALVVELGRQHGHVAASCGPARPAPAPGRPASCGTP